MPQSLADYVLAHTDRGECNCGKCCDRGEKPDPTGHVADTHFFKVAATHSPDAETFRALVRGHRGEFNEVDPYDGQEHNYLELGGWLGNQGLALQCMGLGALLGEWELLTPERMLPGMSKALYDQLAGRGMVAIQHRALERQG